MTAPLPPKVSSRQFERAIKAFTQVVGADWVLTSDQQRSTYVDFYAVTPNDHLPSAAVAPETVEQIQAILRIANEHKIPLWPISRGKNFGYGAAAPRLSGSVVLDLGRMRKILDVDQKRGTCLLEPGVGFFDLYYFLRDNNIPLWISAPGNSWGSVVGNALEHGFGYTPYGDHAQQVCGMEVVLPNGELVRTGMGAMAGSDCWNLFKYGYGPSWDQLFMQSNFGIVTKMGMWLMPEPEAVTMLTMEPPNEEDIGWVIDALTPLRLRGIIQAPLNIGNFIRVAMIASQRSQWYQGEGALPLDVEEKMRKQFGIGWWGVNVSFFGYPESNQFGVKLTQQAVSQYTDLEFNTQEWHRGEPRPDATQFGVPITFPLQVANWAGTNGGHVGFSPVLPPDSKIALEQLKISRQLFREHGIDYCGSFTLHPRHLNKVNMIVYDKDDEDMTARARNLVTALVKNAHKRGYGEYRAHLSFMDDVAQTFDFNNHAQLHLNEAIKDALDPNGILAPGKQGIWPKAYRESKS